MNRPSKLFFTAWEVVFGAVLLLGLVVYIVATGHKDWWGLSAILYLPPWIQWTLTALAAATLLACFLGAFSKLPAWPGLQKRAWLLLPVLAVGLYLLRVNYPLLGDGWLLTSKLDRAFPIALHWIIGYPEPLAASFFSLFQRFTELGGYATYHLFSVFSAIAILLSIAWFARKRRFSFQQGVLLGVPIFTSGFLALFAGYVENYPLLIAIWTFVLLYTLASATNRSLPFWPLMVAIPVLFLWHHMSLILFPAIGLAGFIRSRKSNLSPKLFLQMLSGLFLFLFLAYLFTPLSRGAKWLLPLTGEHSHDGYTLFSAHHLFDFANEIVLVVPLALFFLIAAFVIQRKLLRDNGFQVFVVAAFFGLAAAFVFNPELGMPRDWDLLAALLLPLSLLSGYALAIANPNAAVYGRVVGAALVSLLLIAVPLMLVNHQWDSSVARYKDLLMIHEERAAYGWESLAGFMWARGDDAGRLDCWEKAAQISNNQRYLQGVGMLAMQMGKYEKARRATAELSQFDPRSFMEANDYFVLFVQLGFVDEAERLLPFLRKFAPAGQNMNVYLSDLARAKGDSTYMNEQELPPTQTP